MKIKKLIEELQKYDLNFEVKIADSHHPEKEVCIVDGNGMLHDVNFFFFLRL